MARDDTKTKAPAIPAAVPAPSFTDQLIEPFSRLRSEIDRLFEDFPMRMPRLSLETAFQFAVPALEMTETKKAYKVTAELPGLEAKDVEVSIEDGMLRIAGEKKAEREEDEKGYRLSERSYGAFERLVRLPAGAEADKIKARYRHGVLTIAIPKDGKASAHSRRIAVE